MRPKQPPSVEILMPAEWRAQFRRRLMAWYRRSARDLLWRKDSDPYRVWLSEVMLQQTQVETVKPYFARFVAALPDLAALAAAREEQVLRLWEGLGYYRRARQLHTAARQVMTDHGGELPRDVESLRRLPGIGRYTAGAIASIAFDVPTPILEANTARLFARLLGERRPLGAATVQSRLWQAAELMLPRRGAGQFNQALMELGSLICGPRPKCQSCPVVKLCKAAQQGLQSKIPAAKRRPKTEIVQEAAAIVKRRGRVLLLQRNAGERWAGMWDFPRFTVDTHDHELPAMLAGLVREQTGACVIVGEQLGVMRYGVTRFSITLTCFSASAKDTFRAPAGRTVQWFKPGELHDLPLSATGRRLAKLV